LLNHQFVADYLRMPTPAFASLTWREFVRDVELPGIGSAGGFDGKREDTETFYSFTSFTTPNTIYRYDMVPPAKAPSTASPRSTLTRRLHHYPGVLPQQRRHPHSHVHHPQKGALS
jgi:hypothetical protein